MKSSMRSAMRRWLGVAVVLATSGLTVACEVEPPDCPSSIAEDTFVLAIKAGNATNGSGTYNCAGGGTAKVTNMSTTNGSTRTADVTVEFSSCLDPNAVPHVESLTRTGTFHYSGTMHQENTSSGSGYFCTNCTMHSDGMKLNGTVLLCNVSTVDATCPIDFTVTNDTANALFADTAVGSVCGLKFP